MRQIRKSPLPPQHLIVWSIDFLIARIARMIIFEYHAIGMWGPGSDKVQLKQVVDTLDAAGYSCNLQGKDTSTCDSAVQSTEVFSQMSLISVLLVDDGHPLCSAVCNI